MSSSSLSSDKETTYLLLGTSAKSNHNFQYGEALMHLVKGYVGTGIFSMGDAFKHSGIIPGSISVFCIGLLCLHCCHLLNLWLLYGAFITDYLEYQGYSTPCKNSLILDQTSTAFQQRITYIMSVNTSRTLYEKYNLKTIPGYADAAKLCFQLGAHNLRFMAKFAKLIVNIFLVMGQIGFCSCYLVFISRNIQEVIKVYHSSWDIHCIIVIVIFPIWLTCLIRTLELLSPLSIIANLILMTSIVIVLYYAFCLPLNVKGAKLKSSNPSKFLIFVGQTVFAFEGIGLVLILYGEMEDQQTFQGTCGVLNSGLIIVTTLYAFFGAITYLQFGDDVKDTVTLNLTTTEELAQAVLILISIGVIFSFSLQLYVAVDILWPKIMERFGPFSHPIAGELVFRTFLVTLIFAMSQATPNLEILLSFVGSFISVALIIIFPAIMDLVTIYSLEEITAFLFIKDTLIVLLGIFAMAAGTYQSLALIAEK